MLFRGLLVCVFLCIELVVEKASKLVITVINIFGGFSVRNPKTM